MLFMAVFHAGPYGLGTLVPARWQHGPTPGVKVIGAWTSSTGGIGPEGRVLGTESRADHRTYIAFECETSQQVAGFVSYLRPFCPRVEVREITDYMPWMRAYDSRDPEQRPRGPNVTDEQRRADSDEARRYINASTPSEAISIWLEETPQGKELARIAKVREQLGVE